ncbi:Xaa-Pro peptidase family protein [Paenibacillus sp. P96]|uniref:Xaa-Pro peptidase family protein n=1 Tax=Paenibacillus zeirhizosphaerae TaxID=2987519 RepID=A0ABT9FLH7_9BACL|nr:Xaa-Pro peptidase family protein [Paenibacillus sp. P96]MDP4095381.1 Xaa-Pro peptidase family protein [Paenibacillus sp. P96]
MKEEGMQQASGSWIAAKEERRTATAGDQPRRAATPLQGVPGRLARLRAEFHELGIDAMLVTQGPNRRYMTGFTGSAGIALITEQEAFLVTDFRYTTQAAEQAPEYSVLRHEGPILHTVADLARKSGIQRLGVESRHVSLQQSGELQTALGSLECVLTEDVVERLRDVKDEEEIRTISEAVRITDAAFTEVLNSIKPGVTERRIAAELEYRLRLAGADSGAYAFIVASGERSALPHGLASDKEIGRDEFVTLDFGANVRGYLSDLTRTVFVGKPSERHEELYAIVLEANQKTIAGLRPGLSGREGDSLGRDVIASYGYGEHFGHGLGHGFGLEIHEQVRLSRESKSVLVPGHVLTVEPGIYIPGFGGVRIEDDVLITDDGVKVLTSSPKELLVL